MTMPLVAVDNGGYCRQGGGILGNIAWLFLLLSSGCPIITAQQQAATDTATVSSSCASPLLQPKQVAPDGDDNNAKTVYRVGVLASRGSVESALDEFAPTFTSYLSATAGAQFIPSIEFQTITIRYDDDDESRSVLDRFEQDEYDFVYAHPGIFSCLEHEVGANSLASQISRRVVNGQEFNLTHYGGVIFTSADNKDINSIVDLEGKRIAAASISDLGSGQMQFRELQLAGLHHLQDPKQVIFMGTQEAVVNAVLNGQVDVGFVRTDQLERSMNIPTGERVVDQSLVKIIGGQQYRVAMENGKNESFPYTSSTLLYPEWNLASMPGVSDDVAQAVQSSLLQLDEHAAVGIHLKDCLDLNNCSTVNTTPTTCIEDCFASIDDSMFKRCDTTSTIALLAATAMDMGRYAGWRSSLSYIDLFIMQQDAGFVIEDERGYRKCIRSTTLPDSIVCPPGHELSERDIEMGCEVAGLPCYGFQCLCSPCNKIASIVFFPSSATVENQNNDSIKGCDSLSLCGTVEQGHSITFHAIDNKKRLNPIITAGVPNGDSSGSSSTKELTMHRIATPLDPNVFMYELTLDASNMAAGIVLIEVFVDGQQIQESPFRVQVEPRDCAKVTGDSFHVADASGQCVCNSSDAVVEINNTCVSLKILLPCILVPIFLLIVLLILHLRWKRKRADAMWKVKPEEIIFQSPPRILGRGTFGLVLLAQYKDKKVAVKRVLPLVVKDPPDTRPSPEQSRSTSANQVDTELERSQLGRTAALRENVSIATTTSPAPKARCLSAIQPFSGHDVETGKSSGRDGSFRNSTQLKGKQSNNGRKLDPCSKKIHISQRHLVGGAQTLGDDSLIRLGFQTRRGASTSRAAGLSRARFAEQEREFIQEMRQISMLRHPCIAAVMGAVISKRSEPVIIIEHVALGSLHDLLHNNTMIIDGEMALSFLRDIAAGLRFLHSANPEVCHCDLKSQNVLVDTKFHAKVCDFGISRRRVKESSSFWIAPELLGKEPGNTCTTASDIYAFGIVMWEVLSRKEPYEGENQEEVLEQVADPNVNMRPAVPAGCTPQTADLMKDCLLRAPNARPTAEILDVRLKMLNVEQVEPATSIVSLQAGKGKRSEDILAQLFPKHVADALREGRKFEPETHDCVTVFFSDIVDYTSISSQLSPTKVSNMLDRLYTKFDELCDIHNVFKVETVGDAYMAVTNLATAQPEHTRIMAYFALDAVYAASDVLIDEEEPSLGYVTIRAGMHSGPVVGHVVGSKTPRYSLIGDTVNTAARMESNSLPGRLQCSDICANILLEQSPDLNVVARGMIEIKGKGSMRTFWVRSFARTTPNKNGIDPSMVQRRPSTRSVVSLEDKKGRLIQWNVDVLLGKLQLVLAHREASKLLQQLPGLDQMQSASSAIRNLPGVEQVSSASSALLNLPAQASSALLSLPGLDQASSALLNLPNQAASKLTRRPSLLHIAEKKTTLEEVQDIIYLPPFNRRVARKEQSLLEKTELPHEVAEQMHDYVSTIAHMYRDNPFHNFEHASQVALSMTKLLSRIVAPSDLDWDENDTNQKHMATKVHDYSYGIASDPLTQFAVVFSALIHDVDHSGVPNAQLVKENAGIANLYKGRSVAEQNSVDLAWQLLMDPQYEALQKCIFQNKTDMKRFRQLVVNSVMATDIVDKDLKALRNKRWDTAFAEKPADENPQDCINRKATIVIEHLIQASDVGHTMQQWNIYRRWNERFFQECYEAFKAGRSENDPTEGWYKGEIGFFDFYIIPLAKKLKDCGVFGFSSDECLQYALKNRKLWEDQGQQVIAEMIENFCNQGESKDPGESIGEEEKGQRQLIMEELAVNLRKQEERKDVQQEIVVDMMATIRNQRLLPTKEESISKQGEKKDQDSLMMEDAIDANVLKQGESSWADMSDRFFL